MVILVLLGAEGVADIIEEDWMRDAAPHEVILFRQRHKLTHDKYQELLNDGTGRPYFLVALEQSAPRELRERAQNHVRLLRLGK